MDCKTNKASYSSIGFREKDYDTNFMDVQRLQTICDDLNLTISILDANMDIAHAIKDQCRDLRRLKILNWPDDSDVLTRVQLDTQRLKGFKRAAVALRAQAQGTTQLASKIHHRTIRSHSLMPSTATSTTFLPPCRYPECSRRSASGA